MIYKSERNTISSIIKNTANAITCPLNLFRFLKFCGRLMASWPVNADAKKSKIFLSEIIWWILFFNYLTLTITTSMSIYQAPFSFSLILTLWLELTLVVEILMLITICRIQRSRMQILLQLSERYISLIDNSKSTRIKKFYYQYVMVFGFLIGLFIVGLTVTILKPLFSSSMILPSTGWYPYKVQSSVTWVFLYAHQIMVATHTPVILNGDGITILLILVPIGRLAFLKTDYANANQYSELIQCIRKHQDIIIFFDEANIVIRLMLFKTISCLCPYLCVGGFHLLYYNIWTIEFMKYSIVMAVAITRTCMYTYCTENMLKICNQLCFSIYSTCWYKQTREMMIAKSIIIYRCQRPLKTSIYGITPIVGLQFFSRFMYVTFSYIMTLRAMSRGTLEPRKSNL